jgi:hypothetical protein
MQSELTGATFVLPAAKSPVEPLSDRLSSSSGFDAHRHTVRSGTDLDKSAAIGKINIGTPIC